MRFRVLGPLEVVGDENELLPLRGRGLRTLLAALLVHAGEVVSADRLALILWPSAPPGSSSNALQTQVSRLRRVVAPPGAARPGAQRIANDAVGYVLRVEGDELDADRFDRLATEARRALDTESWEVAADSSQRALACWRGDALAEFADREFARARIAQLDEARLLTVECSIDARLGLGRHRELVGELEDLVGDHPLREQLWAKLMLALYRSGRQSEALRAFSRLRGILAEELGISPCHELTQLERAVLDQDPTLEWRPGSSSPHAVPVPGGAASAPPAGDHPVTFLFTDVQQSTAIWDREPEQMAVALRRHDEVLRSAIHGHAGHVFGHPGDGFCAAFPRAADAVAAAVTGQRELGGRAAEPLGLLVRMALHTGDAEQRDGNYFGPTVNRVARMRDAGHGGQVLASAATRELVLDDLPEGCGLVDIGSWVFDGVSRAVRVFELTWSEQPPVFPPLRSAHPESGRLQRSPTSFIGRQRECEAVASMLGPGRIVTLTGDGGMGKTRLALEVAARISHTDVPDGTWFCDLSEARGAVEVAETVAGTLGITGGDLADQIARHLASRRMLFVLDNCEYERDAVASLVGAAVRAGPGAAILVTSRVPLRVDGEHVLRIEPLALPAPDDPHPATAPAVQLLRERAVAAGAGPQSDEAALVQIARSLEGVPLTIELAAARLATMPVSALADRLDRRLELLGASSGTVPPHHRTLRATIDWSFDLLGPDAQLLLAAVSTFSGGWTIDTAESVVTAAGLAPEVVAPLMSELVEHSLLRLSVDSATTARYTMLETIREYAAERLAATGQRAAVAERHAQHFTALAERAVEFRRGPLEPAWARELAAEFANLRAAAQWAVGEGRDDLALRLAVALTDDVLLRGRFEIGRWAEDAARIDPARHQALRCAALGLAANAAIAEGRYDDALSLSSEALAIEDVPEPDRWLALNVIALLRAAGLADGPWQDVFDGMVATSVETGDPYPGAVARFLRVLLYAYDGRGDLASADADDLLEIATAQANPSLLAMALLSAGRTRVGSDPAGARQDFRHALSSARSARSAVLVEQAERAIVELDARAGDRAGALASFRSINRHFIESGDLSQQMQTVMSMLDSLVAMGALEQAARICGALERTPWRLTSAFREVDGALATHLGEAPYAAARRTGSTMQPSEVVAFAARLAQELTEEAGDGPND